MMPPPKWLCCKFFHAIGRSDVLPRFHLWGISLLFANERHLNPKRFEMGVELQNLPKRYTRPSLSSLFLLDLINNYFTNQLLLQQTSSHIQSSHSTLYYLQDVLYLNYLLSSLSISSLNCRHGITSSSSCHRL